MAELVAPAAALARAGVALNAAQAYVIEILGGIVTSTPESSALFAPEGRLIGEGDVLVQPELADALELLGADGAAPFYTGEVGRGGRPVGDRPGRHADRRRPRRLRGA